MTNFNEKKIIIGSPDYGREFWNAMKGIDILTNSLSKCKEVSLSGYPLPIHADSKFTKVIKSESIMRNLATVHNAYGSANLIWTRDCKDIAMWVAEGGEIPIYDGMTDFTKLPVDFHKLAVFVKLDTDFVHDAAFDI